MTRQCGGQTGGFFGGLRKFCADNRPPLWKLYGNALDVSAAQAVKDSGAFLIAREVRGDQFDPDEDIPAAVARALRYADLVISRAGPFVGLVNAWEFYNEPVINISFPDGTPNMLASIKAATSLNAAQVAFSNKLHSVGLKVVAYNLARGNPFYELFPLLADGCAVSDYIGLHAYGPPLYEIDADNQALRYRRLYASLPTNARKPIIFTEHGTDFHGGGFRLPANNLTTAQFFASMDWWLTQLAVDASYVFGAVAFVVGADSGRWETFEIAEDDSLPLFAALCQKEYQGGSTPPPNPEPEPTVPITPAETVATVPFLVKRAIQLDLGPSIYGEYNAKSANGDLYHAWIWQRGGVIVKDGDYGSLDNAKLFNPQTGEPMAQPLPWPGGGSGGGIPAFAVPPMLPQFGASATAGVIVPNQPFYRLMGATVRAGVSAFCKITVLAKSGAPAVGIGVLNLRPDGNFEKQLTDGSGVVQYFYGAGSAFTTPGTGPFTNKMADFAGDSAISLGDFQGTHTEWYLQFQQVQ